MAIENGMAHVLYSLYWGTSPHEEQPARSRMTGREYAIGNGRSADG